MVDRGQDNDDIGDFREATISLAMLNARHIRRLLMVKYITIALFVSWIAISVYFFLFKTSNLPVVGIMGLSAFSIIYVFWPIYGGILKDNSTESWQRYTFKHIDQMHEVLFMMASRNASDPVPSDLVKRAGALLKRSTEIANETRKISTQYGKIIIKGIKLMSVIELIVVTLSTVMISFSFA